MSEDRGKGKSFLDAINQIAVKRILPAVTDEVFKVSPFLSKLKRDYHYGHAFSMREVASEYGYGLWVRPWK